MQLLGEALALAQPGGFIRLFVDEGLPMAQLLSEAASRGIMPDYVGKLLAVFKAEQQKRGDKSHLTHAQPLIEPLSHRELEVLQLIAQGLSNREISERLFLALSTVKGHSRIIFDKLQVRLYTEEDKVKEIVEKARQVYQHRDRRIEGMTDEGVETYYSCTLCQSFAPSHVCVISPERTGLCGSYNWMDCKASFEINPTGPNQPVPKGNVIDQKLGQWQGVNEFVTDAPPPAKR